MQLKLKEEAGEPIFQVRCIAVPQANIPHLLPESLQSTFITFLAVREKFSLNVASKWRIPERVPLLGGTWYMHGYNDTIQKCDYFCCSSLIASIKHFLF